MLDWIVTEVARLRRDLGAVDRCITCHSGLEDPRMAAEPQPFTTHPGRYLEMHDPARFGCTVCHRGQGRATATADAHGAVPYWDFPMYETRFVHARCTRCHAEEELYAEVGLFARAVHGVGCKGSRAPVGRGSVYVRCAGSAAPAASSYAARTSSEGPAIFTRPRSSHRQWVVICLRNELE